MPVLLGRDLALQIMEMLGIEYMFGNPGTAELPFVDGCAQHKSIRYVTSLHEAVAVGMAMGYARQSGKPGVAVLHMAPGLANGMSNIYNAYRAGIPLVILSGQHHSDFLLYEPILSGDVVGQVQGMTRWAHEVRNPSELPLALQRAFKVSMTPPTGPVFLSIPYDILIAPAAVSQLAPPTPVAAGFSADSSALAEIARALLRADRPLIVAGDGIGKAGALDELAGVAERAGVGVMSENMPTRQNFDNRHPLFLGTLPMQAGTLRSHLAEHDLLFFAGVESQAAVALYDGGGPLVPPGIPVVYLNHDPWEIGKNYPGLVGAWGEPRVSLSALSVLLAGMVAGNGSAVHRRCSQVQVKSAARRERLKASLSAVAQKRPMSAALVAAELARVLPASGAFTVVNESISNAAHFVEQLPMWQPGHYLMGKGGGLGHGLPQAIGTALADPGRMVVGIAGDGTFLYYPQVLYSAVKTSANVLFLIINNNSYHILKQGLKAMGGPWGSHYPKSLDLDGPINLIQLAASFGVPGQRVEDPEALASALDAGTAANGPYLVEVLVSP